MPGHKPKKKPRPKKSTGKSWEEALADGSFGKSLRENRFRPLEILVEEPPKPPVREPLQVVVVDSDRIRGEDGGRRLVRRKELEPHGSPEDVRCALALDFSLIVPGKLGDIDPLSVILQGAVNSVIERCKELGFESYLRVGEVKPVPHEVLMSLIPRKVHFETDEHIQACKTPFVSPKNLTTDDEKVTCKLCRKLRGL